MNVADGIVDAVEIVGIVGVLGHALELTHHGASLPVGHHLGLQDAGVEGQFIRRIQPHTFLERLVGGLLIACQLADLSEQVVETRTLEAALGVLGRSRQRCHSLGILPRGYIIGGTRGIGLALSLTRNAVAANLAQDILSIVGPIQQHVTTRQLRTRHAGHTGLVGIETEDVVVAGCGLEEVALLEMSVGKHQPSMTQIGVELLAGEIGFLLVGHAPRRLLGLALDAVLLDGFLAFLNGCLEAALAQAGRLLVHHHIHRQQTSVIIHMALLLSLDAFLESHLSVVERVEMGGGGVVETRKPRVLFRRTRRHTPQNQEHEQYVICSRARFHLFIVNVGATYLL